MAEAEGKGESGRIQEEKGRLVAVHSAPTHQGTSHNAWQAASTQRSGNDYWQL